MRFYACGGSFLWSGSRWLPQYGWFYNWESAPLFLLSPGWFSIVQLKWCSVWLALLGRLHVHSTKMFLLLVGHCWIHLDLVLGSFLWGAPVGALWTRNLVLFTGTASTVVWLRWGALICGVRLSCSLAFRFPVFWLFNTVSLLFRSIDPLSSLGLPHIFVGVLKWGGLRPFYSCI